MTWQTDPAHTHLGFVARHMMLAKVRGQFDEFQVDLDLDDNEPDKASVVVTVNTASVNTRDAQRDTHLRSPDFFNADAYPHMVFKSTRVQRTGEETAKLYGELTIRDVTKPVILDVTYLGKSKSPWGATSIGFEANTKINRKDWNLVWNVALESGGWLVGDEIELNIESEFIQQNGADN